MDQIVRVDPAGLPSYDCQLARKSVRTCAVLMSVVDQRVDDKQIAGIGTRARSERCPWIRRRRTSKPGNICPLNRIRIAIDIDQRIAIRNRELRNRNLVRRQERADVFDSRQRLP